MVCKAMQLRSGWCDIIAEKLKKANSYCSFGFRKGWIQTLCSRKWLLSVVFRATAYCTFNGCLVSCDITGTRVNESGIALCANFSGEIHHNRGERKARRINGAQRESLKAKFSTCSPSSLYGKFMDSLPIDMLVSGNRDGVGGTASVYQKISSEGKQEERHDENLIKSVMMLKDEFCVCC